MEMRDVGNSRLSVGSFFVISLFLLASQAARAEKATPVFIETICDGKTLFWLAFSIESRNQQFKKIPINSHFDRQ